MNDVTKAQVYDTMWQFIKNYMEENSLQGLVREPIIRYADAADPGFAKLKNLVFPEHHVPEDFLPGAKTVISYFLPLTKASAGVGEETEENHAVYNRGFGASKVMKFAMELVLVELFQVHGWEATPPLDNGLVSDQILVSRWSEKHVGYIAGLGTFGENNFIITEEGCCGRIGSLITTMPFEPDEQVKEEYCIHKRNGKCGACVKKCPTGALGFSTVDGFVCRPYNHKNQALHPELNACSECSKGVPCSFKAPK